MPRLKHEQLARRDKLRRVARATTPIRIVAPHRSGFSCDKCGLSLECFGSRPAMKRHAAECSG
jgi:hypothetical protein